MTPCRVLIVSYNYWPDYAGWLKQTITMVRACDPNLVTFSWISRSVDGLPKVDQRENLNVRRIGSVRDSQRLGVRIAFGLDATRYLINNRLNYDVIYLPISYTPTDIVTMATLFLKKPSVVRVARGEFSPEYFLGRARLWFLPKLASAVVVLNKSLISIQNPFVKEKFHWIPNGVDTMLFHPVQPDSREKSRRQWGFENKQKIILFVGSIVVRKGIDILLSAFSIIAEKVKNAVLCLAGPTDIEGGKGKNNFAERYQENIQREGLKARVRFLPHVFAVEELMRAADIFVLPSRSEGMPNVLLEAMATGLPCVASDIPGIKELIVPDDNGLLFPPEDPYTLAKHLIRLLNDSAERQRLGHRARQTIEQQFSIKKTAQNYQSLFLQLVTRSNSMK